MTNEPFMLRGGEEIHSVEELLEHSTRLSSDILYHLLSGHFEPWLLHIGHEPLAHKAAEIRQAVGDDDHKLREFIAAAKAAMTLPEAAPQTAIIPPPRPEPVETPTPEDTPSTPALQAEALPPPLPEPPVVVQAQEKTPVTPKKRSRRKVSETKPLPTLPPTTAETSTRSRRKKAGTPSDTTSPPPEKRARKKDDDATEPIPTLPAADSPRTSQNITPQAVTEQILAQYSAGVNSVTFSPDGLLLAVLCTDGAISLWNMKERRRLKWPAEAAPSGTSLAFSPNGDLAVGGQDTTIHLWEVSSGTTKQRLVGHTNRVHSVAFGSQSQLLASGGADRTIRLWQATTGQEVRLWEATKGRMGFMKRFIVQKVLLSQDERLLASVWAKDETVHLWDVTSGQPMQLEGHQAPIHSIAFSPDGTMLASGGDDQTVSLWQVANGQEVAHWQGNMGVILSLSFSPDGSRLAVGDGAGVIHLWDVAAGQRLEQLTGRHQGVQSIAFSLTGDTLVSGSEDGAVQLWSLG